MSLLSDFGNGLFSNFGRISEQLLSLEQIILTSSRTLTNSDNGMLLVYSGSTDITLTIPIGLENYFNCTVLQQGTGKIIVISAVGVTMSGLAYRTIISGGSLIIEYTGTETYSVNPYTPSYYISEAARTYAAGFVTEFASEWVGTDAIVTWDTTTVVSSTAALNTAINTACLNPSLKTRIRIAANFANTTATTINCNGTSTAGDFIAVGGALLIDCETTPVTVTSIFQNNGCRGIQVNDVIFARTVTDAYGSSGKNWVPGDTSPVATDPQDATQVLTQRVNSTRPLWPVIHFKNCKFGGGFVTADAKDWITPVSLNSFEEVIFKNCSWKGAKTHLKIVNGRRFKNINSDFQLALRDVMAGTNSDIAYTFGTITGGTVTLGSPTITGTLALSAQFLQLYPGGLTAGMTLSGTGIAANTTVLSWTGSAIAPTDITMSANATSTSTATINVQDNLRSKYASDPVMYVWVIGVTSRNLYDNYAEMTDEATPRYKQYWLNHCDFIQLGAPTDKAGYKELVENPCIYHNRTSIYDDVGTTIRVSGGGQAIYNDDSDFSLKSVVINAALCAQAQNQARSWNDAAKFENLTVVREGSLCPSASIAKGDPFNYLWDFAPGIVAAQSHPIIMASSLDVRNSIAGDIFSSGTATNSYTGSTLTKFSNVIANPKIGVANYADIFEGGIGAFSIDSEGRNIYTFPDDGTETQAEFRARWYAQFKPKGAAVGRGIADPSKLDYTISNF